MKGRHLVRLAVLLFAIGQLSCGAQPSAVTAGGFEWVVTPGEALTLQRGAAGSFTIRLNSKVNINADVEFSLSGNVPPNGTATFNPVRLASTGRDATLNVQTTPNTPDGAYTLNIMATELGAGTHTLSRRVDVVSGTGPDFTLEVNPLTHTFTDRSLSPTFTYYVRPRNGFLGTVDITVESASMPPSPVLLAQGPSIPQLVFTSGGGQGGTFSLRLGDLTTFPPSVTITVRAASGAIVHTMPVTVNIRLAAAAR